jgi:hypothetical protein
MTRRLLLAVLAIVGAFTFAQPIASAPAQAQTSSTTTGTSTTLPVVENDQLGRSLPKPNSGQKPQGFGDRGGAGQLIVFGLVTTFLAVIVVRIALATRRRTNNNNKVP